MSEAKSGLAGKVAIVSGGGRGIGAAICERLAADGAFVVVNYLARRDAAEDTVLRIEKAGGHAVAIQADIGTMDGIQALYASCDDDLTARFGTNKIDILVNNACILWNHDLDVTESDYDRMMAVNLKAPFFLAASVVSRMPDGGRIINISSASASHAYPAVPVYSIAKHGMSGLTKNLAAYLGPRKINVNGIEPGMTITDAFVENLYASRGAANRDMADEAIELPPQLPDGGADLGPEMNAMVKAMTAFGRVGNCAEVAAVVSFLASDDARWVTGQRFGVDGGLQL